MMTGGGGGVSVPPKNDDVIYEQPLIGYIVKDLCKLYRLSSFNQAPIQVQIKQREMSHPDSKKCYYVYFLLEVVSYYLYFLATTCIFCWRLLAPH